MDSCPDGCGSAGRDQNRFLNVVFGGIQVSVESCFVLLFGSGQWFLARTGGGPLGRIGWLHKMVILE